MLDSIRLRPLLAVAVAFVVLVAWTALAHAQGNTTGGAADDIGKAVHVIKNWSTVGFLVSVSGLCAVILPRLSRSGVGAWLAAKRIDVRLLPWGLGRFVPAWLSAWLYGYSFLTLAQGIGGAFVAAGGASALGHGEQVLTAAAAGFVTAFNPAGHSAPPPPAGNASAILSQPRAP